MPETIVYTRDQAGLPYSKGLTAQQLSASGISPERSYELARLVELDPDHEAHATHFLDERMLRAQFTNAADEFLAVFAGPFDQVFLFQHLERGEAAGHGEVVPAEGGGVDDAAIQP